MTNTSPPQVESIVVSLEWAKKLLLKGWHRRSVVPCSERASGAAKRRLWKTSTSEISRTFQARNTRTGVAIASRKRIGSTIGRTGNVGSQGRKSFENRIPKSTTAERKPTIVKLVARFFHATVVNARAVVKLVSNFSRLITSMVAGISIDEKRSTRICTIGYERTVTQVATKFFATTATWPKLFMVPAPIKHDS